MGVVVPESPRAEVSDANTWVRRLTVAEYIETVRSAVEVDIEEARSNLNIDLAHVEAYARLAEMIAGKMDVLAFARKFAQCEDGPRNVVGYRAQYSRIFCRSIVTLVFGTRPSTAASLRGWQTALVERN